MPMDKNCESHDYLDQNYKVNLACVGICSISLLAFLTVFVFGIKTGENKSFLAMVFFFALMFLMLIVMFYLEAKTFKT